ncbi:recombinase family protein [Clostridioides difficile]|nr:recombinase family protein [Clostridioides difficile]EGT3939399.1 recombinase family protein [Clostridioides difficile]EGT5145562.1 recombinase family protein [Clostridioides difficile]
MMKVLGYCRCSTNEEKQDIDRQIRDIKQLAKAHGHELSNKNIFTEYESGAKIDRIELNRMLDSLGEGDIIISTEVSRISRSTKQLINILELVKEKKNKLILGWFVVDCTKGSLDAMTEGMLKMMGVFAEMERAMTSDRVKSGMANAKAKGKNIGRPKTSIDSIPNIFLKHYSKYKNKEINISEFSRLCNMSRTTIYKYIKLLED